MIEFAPHNVKAFLTMELAPARPENPVVISPATPLVLASTSKYRAELLARLQLPFVQEPPGIDEADQAGELPESRARRLAAEKARAVADRCPGQWVLGSDQVAFCEDEVLHKPGSPEANVEQLLSLSGREVHFATALCLTTAGGIEHLELDLTVVRFRPLDRAAVTRYVAAEPAHDCAGGFKVEGLGISLFDAVESRDPTALIGLPLIALRRMLEKVGSAVP
ncbi:MAG: Maf-like protein [Hydrocarboniphaga sp.]|nr:Maf-like protein [Hydrocarboniphaga sp.]